MKKKSMFNNKCWMCRKKDYSVLDKEVDKEERVERILEDKKDYYVIVPQDPHLFGHILIVLKKHCKNLTYATIDDLQALNGPVIKWTKILKESFGDCRNVFVTCLCDNDNVHLHYHLFPVREKEKPQKGYGHQWLGVNEERVDKKPFSDCSGPEKKARGKYIREMVDFLNERKNLT